MSRSVAGFNTLIPTCQSVTEEIIRRSGGKITDDSYLVAVQKPRPPETLEQWTDQTRAISQPPITAAEMQSWAPGWKLLACGPDADSGIAPRRRGRENVLVLHPVSQTQPAAIQADLQIPAAGKPRLTFELASHPRGNFLLKIFVNDKSVRETVVTAEAKWTVQSIDLTPHAGQKIPVRIEIHANIGERQSAFLRSLAFERIQEQN